MRLSIVRNSYVAPMILSLFVILAVGLFFAGCGEQSPQEPVVISDTLGGAGETAGDRPQSGSTRPMLSALNGLVTGDASLSETDIDCDGSTEVTLTLNGALNIQANPVDIILMLDRSGSMGGQPLADLKTAALEFVDHLDEVSDGVADGSFGNSRVGVVSFTDGASLDQALVGTAGPVQTAINGLVTGNMTNTAAGFNVSRLELLDCAGPGDPPDCATRPKMIIVVTDGQPTVPAGDPVGEAAAAALAARNAGIEIFCIGFGSVTVANLNNWATDPDAAHVFTPANPSELPDAFDSIGAQIILPGGTDIVVEATVFSHFSIGAGSHNKGTVTVVGNVLTWEIDELGDETVTLTYVIIHDPNTGGGPEVVHDSLTYDDNEGNAVNFPVLVVNVHLCAANIDLTPDSAINELGTPGQTHTVTAEVTDDFGDPVESVTVDFDVTAGPNVGGAGTGVTDAAGQTPFTYMAIQGLAGLGTDVIMGCYTDNTGGCDRVIKEWVDTTPPEVDCAPGMNPAGKIPAANNEDGFYMLFAEDLVDPNPFIFVDAGDGVIFGPFPSGVNIHYVEAPGATPSIMPGPGMVDWRITGNMDLTFYGVDASGNQSDPTTCYVAPPPKKN